ncbi:MAG TPA: 5-bromo-4-chloroindolyl phosphate hydrolysis protein [Epulopiscium sp.]|nr:5-bromo-4-chloroindolyl phosphate hydrolysis protein [Candidatus Epulonipiscium sp.]
MGNWDKVQNKLDIKSNKLTVPVGKVSGVLYTAFGGIGAVGFGIPITVMSLLGYTIGRRIIFHTIAGGLFIPFIISIFAITNGNRIQKRLSRFQRYVGRLNNRYYCPIKELSSATGQSDKATVNDLKKMIAIGMFPEGHIDEQKTYFMLNHQCYEEYLKLQKSAKMKELELKAKALEIKNNKRDNKKDPLTQEQRKVIDDGRELIKQIKHANDLIPGEELSHKLNKLEAITERIFEYVEAHPEKIPQLKRFTVYFLPTTLKLAKTYTQLDDQPVQGQNISTAKQEIEETMDTIYDAFENLLDGLFEDVALDVSTDISVLETMFAQEGLTGDRSNFKNKL